MRTYSPGPEGPRVHEDEPARGLADDAGRTDRHHEAQQHREPLERVAVPSPGCTGRPSPARTPRRRSSRAGASAARNPRRSSPPGRAPTAPRRRTAVSTPPHAARDQENRDHDDEVGQRRRPPRPAAPVTRLDQESVELLAPRAGEREETQEEPHPFVGDEQHEAPSSPARSRNRTPRSCARGAGSRRRRS